MMINLFCGNRIFSYYLVSRSVEQMREVCNKILWLDHGKQVYFVDGTKTICNAYEEFLIARILPKNRQQNEALSSAARLETGRKNR